MYCSYLLAFGFYFAAINYRKVGSATHLAQTFCITGSSAIAIYWKTPDFCCCMRMRTYMNHSLQKIKLNFKTQQTSVNATKLELYKLTRKAIKIQNAASFVSNAPSFSARCKTFPRWIRFCLILSRLSLTEATSIKGFNNNLSANLNSPISFRVVSILSVRGLDVDLGRWNHDLGNTIKCEKCFFRHWNSRIYLRHSSLGREYPKADEDPCWQEHEYAEKLFIS